MMMARFPVAVAGMMMLAGCSLIPDYERPQQPVAETWPSGTAYGAYGRDALGSVERPAPADLSWRDFFTDPQLQGLILTALEDNRDLRVATLNVEAARAQYQIQRADLFPSVQASASGLNERIPARLSASGTSYIQRQYGLNVGFTSYELDLFGRVRSLKEQALETYLARDETRASAEITLVAEVANAYLTLLADRELRQLTVDTLLSQQESYDLTRRSYENGVASELDLRQAEISVRNAESNLALYTRQLAQDRNALTLLVGRPLPEALNSDTPTRPGLDGQKLAADLPAGLPSALLEQRPDIRAAEHSLKAANANIGAARAAFFPTISLTTTGGLADTGLSNLFMGAARTWNFAPNISVPIFEGGRIEANLDYAKVMTRIEVAQYEKAIQTAFREVADALAARGTLDDQVKAQTALVEASSVRYRLAEARFRNGIEGYLNTLDAQRTLFASQQTLVVTRLSRLTNLVTLYKTLGGGWNRKTGLQSTSGESGPTE